MSFSSAFLRFGVVASAAFSLAAASLGCSAGVGPGARSEAADKWFQRAGKDFSYARIDDAHDAIQRALSVAPDDPEVRLLAGRIALTRLDYDESLRLLKGVAGSEARGLRGRAYWYKGDLGMAADELDGMLDDPEVRDEWAKSIAGLARRGEGRTPFSVSGSLLAQVQMARVSPVAPYLVVPVEIDGESALAMVSTGVAEVVIDSSARSEPSWISMRFSSPRELSDSRVEVNDVPALTQDLSGISKELGAPVKALIGVNLLRHLNATVDYMGRQFVVRSFVAPPPPNATRVNLFYARGGGMVMASALGAGDNARASLFVDSAMRFPIALDEQGWEKAGITAADLKPVPGDPEARFKEGVVPLLKLGAFDLRRIPGVLGAPIPDIEKGLKFDVDGAIGSPILANYRITFSDGGRMMWVEDDSALRNLATPQGMPDIPEVEPKNDAERPKAP